MHFSATHQLVPMPILFGKRTSRQIRRLRRGAVLPLIAVILPVLLILIAMFVNIAYMELVRTELRISTDAAARAGSRELALTGDIEMAKARARDAAGRNLVAGVPLQLADADFEFGIASRDAIDARYGFTNDPTHPNALVVRGRRTPSSPGGPVTLFLPNVLGMGQFHPMQQAVSTQIEVDLAIVIDRSGSMAYADTEIADPYSPPVAAPAGWAFGDPIPPDARWLDVINATQTLLNALAATPQSERVSLVTYGYQAVVERTPTTDYASVLTSLDVYTQAFFGGGTNINEGIEYGLSSLADAGGRPWASKIIVVLTDGNYNVGPHPIEAAALAYQNHVNVFTVTFSSEAGQSDMESVAAATGGTHYHAVTGAELIAVFEEIASRLPTLLTN